MNMQRHYYRTIQMLTLSILSIPLTGWNVLPESLEVPPVDPASGYEISLSFTLEGNGEPALLEAYVPVNDERQDIRLISHEHSGFEWQATEDAGGRRLSWRQANADGRQNINYNFHFTGSAISYEMPAGGAIPTTYPESLQSYLKATPAIPSGSTFILRQAGQLSSGQETVSGLAEAFYTYASQLPSQPGPAFATLFYGRKDWKNFLLLALSRAQGIPARVVNGLEIEATGSCQMRQWAELYIGGAWIPFDAAAQHFAFLPENYLTLYRGQTSAFQHSANLNVQTRLEIAPRTDLLGAVIRY